MKLSLKSLIVLAPMLLAANLAFADSIATFKCQDLSQDNDKTIVLKLMGSKNAYTISATTGTIVLFQANDQRPSLNVRISDKPNASFREFVDFNPKGLEVVPVDGKNKLEIDLNPGVTAVQYADKNSAISLACLIDPVRLVSFLGIKPTAKIPTDNVAAVAFDIDDTLMFTTPAFARGLATGGMPTPDNALFWKHTNGCDGGCPATVITLKDGSAKILAANEPSTAKAKAVELIAYHKSLGHKVYAITARPDINGDPLRDYMVSEMGLDRENIYFEPDLDQPGNPAGKTDRIESLNLDIFYGDSDSDITDTMKAFVDSSGVQTKKVIPIRFLRAPQSSNRKAGELNKYHPGYYGERILSGSY